MSDNPERRVLRGCIWIVVLLVISLAVNYSSAGRTPLTIGLGALLVVAIIGLIVVNRSRQKQS